MIRELENRHAFKSRLNFPNKPLLKYIKVHHYYLLLRSLKGATQRKRAKNFVTAEYLIRQDNARLPDG